MWLVLPFQDTLRYYLGGSTAVTGFFTIDADTGMLRLRKALENLPGTTRLQVGIHPLLHCVP